jgi:hypothetical protein
MSGQHIDLRREKHLPGSTWVPIRGLELIMLTNVDTVEANNLPNAGRLRRRPLLRLEYQLMSV